VIAGSCLGENFVLWAYSRGALLRKRALSRRRSILLLYVNWFDRSWAKVVLGLFVARGMLFGKLFLALVDTSLVFGAVLLFEKERCGADFCCLIGPAMASVLASNHGYSTTNADCLAFLWEHAAGGERMAPPHGFESPRHISSPLISFADRAAPVHASAQFRPP